MTQAGLLDAFYYGAAQVLRSEKK